MANFSICDFVADLRAPTPSAAAELAVRSCDELATKVRVTFERMSDAILEKIAFYRERIRFIETGYAFRQPLDLIRQFQQRLDESRRIMSSMICHKMAMSRERLNGLERRLSVLKHTNVLKRGYSICARKDDGKIIRAAEELQRNDDIEIRFSRGKVTGTINEVLS